MKKNANWWFVMRKNKPQKLLRIMKLIFLMCVCIATSVSARSLAQQRITMQLGETGLKAVFKEISRQTSKTVIYNDDLLKFDGKVRADFIDVEDVITELSFDGIHLTQKGHEQLGKTIVDYMKKSL